MTIWPEAPSSALLTAKRPASAASSISPVRPTSSPRCFPAAPPHASFWCRPRRPTTTCANLHHLPGQVDARANPKLSSPSSSATVAGPAYLCPPWPSSLPCFLSNGLSWIQPPLRPRPLQSHLRPCLCLPVPLFAARQDHPVDFAKYHYDPCATMRIRQVPPSSKTDA